jgi:hypothetical protein
LRYWPNAPHLRLARSSGTNYQLGCCAVHAGGWRFDRKEFECPRNSHVPGVALHPSYIRTKARTIASYAMAAARSWRREVNFDRSSTGGKIGPRCRPADASSANTSHCSLVFASLFHFTIGRDERSAGGAFDRLVVAQFPRINEGGTSTGGTSDLGGLLIKPVSAAP